MKKMSAIDVSATRAENVAQKVINGHYPSDLYIGVNGPTRVKYVKLFYQSELAR